MYKYNELQQQLNNGAAGLNETTIRAGYQIIEDWCWTYSRTELFNRWKQPHQKPDQTDYKLTILHYNIRNFYTNQCDLLEMIEKYKPAVISLNELSKQIPTEAIAKILFSYEVFKAEGTNTHGGAVIAIDKQLKPISVDCQQQPNIIAAAILVNNKSYNIISTYSSPTEKLPLPILSNVLQNSQANIVLGDFNAKNTTWGCTQTNQKGRELESWLKLNKLNIHNPAMITSLRSKTTIDLVISTVQEASVQCNQLPYNGSDHFPILAEFNDIILKHQQQYIQKINWNLYTIMLSILSSEIEYIAHESNMQPHEWFQMFQDFLSALRIRSTTWHPAKKTSAFAYRSHQNDD
ncbi:unnamed protein product [Rotaria socialis]|nr:unnamed protein product [Rotaria socialis]CAF4192859.1 unnamed protein product [Rotaria socialis]CAF4460429.1 unnamed protein product [Rotaria socialis]